MRQLRGEIYHHGDDSSLLMGKSANAQAANFDEARQRGRRPCDQPAMGGGDMNAVVRHQAGKDERSVRCRLDELERKARFA